MFVFVNVAKFNFVHIMYKKKPVFRIQNQIQGFSDLGYKKKI